MNLQRSVFASVGIALLFATASFAEQGIDNPSARDVAIGARNRNQNYFGNFIYKWTTNINLSLEYRRLITAFRNQPFATARANQFTFSAAYLF